MNKILDVIVLVLIVVYSIEYLNIHYDQFGLHEKILSISPEIEHNWDVLLWIIFGIMSLDVYLKYKKTGNWKIFLKKYWLEVIMLVLIPVFSAFKIIKFAVKIVKTLKMTKSGFKVVHLTKKICRHFIANRP